MSLENYRKKRDFSRTSEPSGGGRRGGRIFVVQLHHASRRHYDFRLELDGVLKSWAVPKGPSFDPAVKRLAVEVEDHPISYAKFAGDIPKGNYGAGHVDIFDHGIWEPVGSARQGLAKGDLKFILHGDILRGSWVLVRTRMQGTKQQWLLIKHQDEFAGPGEADDFLDAKTNRPRKRAARRPSFRKSSPEIDNDNANKQTDAATGPAELEGATPEQLNAGFFSPELCKAATHPPSGDGWLHEVKWDGYRILASILDGKVKLWSRNGIEWTTKLRDVAEALQSLKLRRARLDGEIIALANGRDDFNTLQGRLSEANSSPLLYMLFDIVHAEGWSFSDVPLVDRKMWLAECIHTHPHPLLRYSDHQIGNGPAVYAQATEGGLEGVVSKRVNSSYRGTRSGAWIKSKARLSDEFIVIGFTEPRGSRTGIGALLLAKPGTDGLRYVGRVGTGIGSGQLIELRRRLEKTVVDKPPADTRLLPRKDRGLAIWVNPSLVVEVFYQGIGGKGLLRQPAFKTLRTDKKLADVSAETVGAAIPQGELKPSKRLTLETGSSATTRGVRTRKTAIDQPEVNMQKDDVTITHPDRVVFPALKLTKQDVADYYRTVARWLLPEIAGRPLSVVRCPGGIGKSCFFQKHEASGSGAHIHSVTIGEEDDKDTYLCIDDVQGLLELVQLNVLEFHPWGARSSDPEHADRIVFDLDPHESVSWTRVKAAAANLRDQLESIGLHSFLRTSGGKGLHIVVPLDPPADWSGVKAFSRSVAEAMVGVAPKEFVSVAGENNRKGKIFIDWLRNGRGATSIAAYSLRARDAAGVAMPLDWNDLKRLKAPDAITLKNATKWIEKRTADPWAELDKVRQGLPEL